MRNIIDRTVALHLAEFILTGELAVTDLVSQKTIDELTPWVQAAIAEDDMRLSPIKEVVGKHFSYDDIRFVMCHCMWLANR